MTDIPVLLRRSPTFFYVAAVVLFPWHLVNGYLELGLYLKTTAGAEGYVGVGKSRALLEAFKESVYLVANGALVHILIAIFDKVKRA